MTRPAVFLDRDGVINRAMVRDGKPYPPASLKELEILPRVSEALARLKEAGFLLVVVSNQPDVARGVTSVAAVEAINIELSARLPLDQIRMCYHDGKDACLCRKPQPGMLLEAARELDIDLYSSFMVGDRWRDVEAGQRAGCRTFFIDYAYDERQPENCDYRVHSLADAAETILSLGSRVN
jgi:D-glycero-D-manno-heptose 1,7-bisphosphate phosphatase